jgi:DNA-binding beta-propeller fold protein YncE
MAIRRRRLKPALPALFVLAVGTVLAAQIMRVQLGVQPDGTILVPTNQVLTPIGAVRRTEGARPKDLALSPDGRTLAVLATTRVAFYDLNGTPAGEVPLSGGALGIAWAPDGRTVYASGSNGRIHRLVREGDEWRADGDFAVDLPAPQQTGRGRQAANPQPNGLAVSPDGERLYVALGIRNTVAVVALPELTLAGSVPVGAAPYHLLLSPDGKSLFVANRGGIPAEAGDDETALSAGTAVRIDPRTDAALRGSLSFVDTRSLTAAEVAAGRQPAGMALSRDGRTLYVANTDGDTVSLVDTRRRRITRTFSVRPPGDTGFGQIPTDVALSEDGQTLFVACGGANSVAVASLGARPRVEGYLPAGWFPIALEHHQGGAGRR